MGKFNFVAGGYYGKVGETVGQRWRNKRNVRAYVIPKNPRTEKQQENRENFADCTGATQLALQLNGASRIWDASKNTAFNIRVGESRKFADNGGAFYTYIPVLPYGYNPAYSFSAMPWKNGQTLTWTCTSTDNLGGRKMAVAIQYYNSATSKNVRHIARGTITGSAGAWTLTLSIPTGYEITNESWQVGVSYDDDVLDMPVIYLPAMSLADLKQKVTVTPQSVSLSWNASAGIYTGTITLNTALEASAAVLTTANLSGVLLGVSAAQSTVIQTVTSAGQLSFTFAPHTDALGQRVLFPSGSTCEIAAATFESDNYIYTLNAATLSFSAALVTQNWPVLSLSAVRNADNTFTVDTGITGAASSAGSLSLSAVSYTSQLVAQSVAINCSVGAVSPTLAFSTSSAIAEIVNKSAQTITPSALPTFVKSGVTYTLNPSQTVSVGAGASSFSVSVSAVSIAYNATTNAHTFTFAADIALPSSLNFSGTLTLYGVMQTVFTTQQVAETLAASGATLTATPTLSKDTYNQILHFPAGSTITIPTMTQTVDGYTFTLTGATLSALESNIPAQVYFATWTEDADSLTPLFSCTLSGITNFVQKTCSALTIKMDDEDNFTPAWDDEVDIYYSGTAGQIVMDMSMSQRALGKNNKPLINISDIPTFVCNGITWKLFEATGWQYLNATITLKDVDALTFTGTMSDGQIDVFWNYPTITGFSTQAYPVTYTGGARPSGAYVSFVSPAATYYASAGAWEVLEFFDETGEYIQLTVDVLNATMQSRITAGGYYTFNALNYGVTITLKDAGGTEWVNHTITVAKVLANITEVE